MNFAVGVLFGFVCATAGAGIAIAVMILCQAIKRERKFRAFEKVARGLATGEKIEAGSYIGPPEFVLVDRKLRRVK